MSETKTVAAMVANEAMLLIPDLIRDPALPSIENRPAAERALSAVVTQDAAAASKRVWAAVLAGLTAVLAVPEVQVLLGAWAPVVTAFLSAVLAGWSKMSDPRPTR